VNLLGKGAVARLEGCVVQDCAIGIATYSKAKLEAVGTVVRDTDVLGVRVNNRGEALLSGGSYESDGKVLSVTDGGNVYAGLTKFKHGQYGAWIERDGSSVPRAEFAECDFDSNVVGLQVAETANVELDQCFVINSDSDGLYCLESADISILECMFSGNGGTSVRCDDSSPDLQDSYLGESNGGVTCHGNAYPKLRRNKIWSNNNGIGFVDSAAADMQPCSGSCPPCSNANSFKGNSGYHVSNLSSVAIYAACNYWGKSTPSAAKFYGTVYYTPYLSSDPLPVSQRPESIAPDPKLPRVYRLSGNAPNPFNPTTRIRYEVPSPGGEVTVRIYNVRGQLVSTLLSEHVVPGYHEVQWSGEDHRGRQVASGIYFAQMLAPQFRASRKIVLLK
jgi:hypothetical protein